MIKKFVYIGLLAILIAIAVFVVVSNQEYNLAYSYLQNSTVKNVTASSYNFSYVEMNLSTGTYLTVLSKLSRQANVYLFNSNGFALWRSYMTPSAPSKSGLVQASAMEGSGVLAIYKNATIITIPFAQPPGSTTQASEPLYSVNITQLPSPDTYYFVVDNTNGSASSAYPVNASVLLPPTNSTVTHLAQAQLRLAPEAFVFLGALIGGIVLIVYGYFKKPPEPPAGPTAPGAPATQKKGENLPTQEQIDQLYKSIGKKKRAKKRDSQYESG